MYIIINIIYEWLSKVKIIKSNEIIGSNVNSIVESIINLLLDLVIVQIEGVIQVCIEA